MALKLQVEQHPQAVRRGLERSADPSVRRRRVLATVTLLGIASMVPVTLRQLGIVRHLPDPPIPGFDSDKVNTSTNAYRFGTPDGPLAIAGLAANLPLIAYGGRDRTDALAWAPIALSLKMAVDAAISAWYFWQMPAKEKAWCGYCIAGAAASISAFALSLPEARDAARRLRRRSAR
jgi:uncharacterized membrane protein